MSSYRNQIAVTVLSSLGLAALGVVTGVVVARSLGPTGRGELAVIQLWGALGVTVALLGIPEGLVYKVGREPERSASSWATATGLVVTLGTAVVLVGYLAIQYVLAGKSKTVDALLLPYMLGFFVVGGVGSLPLSVLQGTGEIKRWNVLRALPTIAWAFVVLYGVVADSVRVRFLAIGFLVGCGVANLMSLTVAWRRARGAFRPSAKDISEMLRYGVPLAASAIPYWLVRGGRMAQLYASAVFDPASVGLLAVAVSFAEANLLVPQGVAPVVVSRVLGDLRCRGSDYASATFAKTVRIAILALLFSSSLLFMAAWWAIPVLFGESFRAAVPIALILTAWSLLDGVHLLFSAALRSLGRTQTIFLGHAASALGTAVFLAVFSSRMGLLGVACATVLGGCAGLYVAWRNVREFAATRDLIPRFTDVQLAVGSFVDVRGWRWRGGATRR